MRIVLASQSTYRRAQLESFGLPFAAVRPDCDEDFLKAQGPKDLVELTRFLSLKKAESLRAKFPDDLILGADQLVEFDGKRLDKPERREKAVEQLLLLSGQSHRLITSFALLTPKGHVKTETEITYLRLRPLDLPTIEAYVDLDQPVDCAGAYKIEKAGLGLVESLEGRDPSAIQGLPMMLLSRALEELGYSLSQLWRCQ